MTEIQYEYYPESGRLKTVTDPKGQTRTLNYTVDGLVSSLIHGTPASGTVAVANRSYTYDTDFGRLTGISASGTPGATSISYVPFNPTNTVYGDGRVSQIVYDIGGNTFPKSFTYDKLGRASSVAVADFGETRTFDNLGRVSAATDGLGSWSYNYDSVTELLSEINGPGGRSTELTYHGLSKDLRLASISHLSTTGSLLTRFGYDYNVLGQITKWEIQEQGAGAHGGVSSGATGTDVLTMTYDGSDRLVNQVRTRAFAAAGMGRPSEEWNWRFDRGGNRLSEQLELFGGASGQGAGAGGASVVGREQFGVNRGDQLTSSVAGGPLWVGGLRSDAAQTLRAGAPRPVGATTVTEELRLAGPAWQVDAVANQDGKTSFGAWLEPVSGRLDAGLLVGRKSDGSSTATFTVSTAVATSGPAARGDRFSLTYDANGNLLTRTRGPIPGVGSGPGSTTETVAYQWDAMNNLVKITYPDGSRTEIRRDMAGRPQRFLEYNSAGLVTGSPRNFLWDGARPAAELDLSEYDEPTIDPGFQQPIRRYFAGGELVFDANVWDYVAYYYIRDHLGSVRAVTNEDGAVVARYDYDPYGKPRLTWHSGEQDPLTYQYQPIQFDLLFTGHLYHAKSGLYFAPFRAYDPEIGRWISRDPIDVAGGINLYEYVEGDPVNAVDPWGETPLLLMSPKAFFAGAAAVKKVGTAVVVAGRIGARWAVSAYRSWFGAAASEPASATFGAVSGAALSAANDMVNNANSTPWSVLGSGAAGAFTGGIMGAAASACPPAFTWGSIGQHALATGTGFGIPFIAESLGGYAGHAAGSQPSPSLPQQPTRNDDWIEEQRNNHLWGGNRHTNAVPYE